MNELRLFYCTNHDGHWPVGVASIVLAETVEEAQRLLDEALVRRGLKPSAQLPYLLAELPMRKPHALILRDGDY